MEQTFEKFSNNYKKSLKTAAELALELNHSTIDPLHILYGLMAQKGSVGAELFTALKIKVVDVRDHIVRHASATPPVELQTAPKFSTGAKAIIQKSIRIAFINEHKYIGTEHLLAAILEIDHPPVGQLLQTFNVSKPNLTSQVVATLKNASRLPDLTETFKVIRQLTDQDDEAADDFPANYRQQSILDLFGTELTANQTQNKLDPVIGRDNELARIIQILSRRNKNNPIILGEPGVGKTALVEGLAKKIVAKQVPEILQNKKIYILDLTAAVAGTIYRGEFEGRIKQIIDEVKRRPEVILFIDEIHNIVGTGSASGSMDAANILKPALARGEIRCIGATTFEDYRKSIEGDPALDRRFQPVKLAEPSTEQARAMITGIKSYFENFHQVGITDEAIGAAVELSRRYITDKFLPDKALDLIDEACAAVKVNRQPSPLERKIKALELKITAYQKQKQQAVVAEDYDLAIKLKSQGRVLEEELAKLNDWLQRQRHKISGEISAAHIAKIVAKITGIPVEELVASEKRKVLRLEPALKRSVIGQDEAIGTIAQFVKRAKAGLMPADRPLASFLLVGPSGTGKTHTARVLAKELFGSREALVKIDMSEYGEKFNISKLIGAPAGYVGYKESGQLTEKIKRQPYAIVLFDEIEKANPEVFDLLLQVLEDGYLTDAAGAKINFRNTIIIMTSNLGSYLYNDKNEIIGFDPAGQENTAAAVADKIMTEVKDFFKVEFLNRLDQVICFSPLAENDLQKIVKLEFAELADRLNRQGVTAEFDNSAAKVIVQAGRQADQGARGLKKTIQRLIEAEISQKILEDALRPGDKIIVSGQTGSQPEIKIAVVNSLMV